MGLFIDHGVEYKVLLADGRTVTVVKSRSSDERLSKSTYYNRRKHEWFKYTQCDPDDTKTVVFARECDVELTQDERHKLEDTLRENTATDHGWVEVWSFDSSLESYR
jgi:hypothetical protein